MSWALYPQLVSQAPQHFRSEVQAACGNCFACHSVCSVISLDPSMSKTVVPQQSSKVVVEHELVHLFFKGCAERGAHDVHCW